MIGIIFWCVVSYFLQVWFGLWTGLLLTFVLMFVVAPLIASLSGKSLEFKRNKIIEENLMIEIETAIDKGKTVFLAYNTLNHNFVAQGLDIKELVDNIKTRVTDRNVWHKLPDGDIVQLIMVKGLEGA